MADNFTLHLVLLNAGILLITILVAAYTHFANDNNHTTKNNPPYVNTETDPGDIELTENPLNH